MIIKFNSILIVVCIALILGTAVPNTIYAQDTYLPLQSEDIYTLDRLETISGKLSDNFISSFKSISRKDAVDYLSKIKNNSKFGNAGGLLSIYNNLDYYNIQRALSISGEWAEDASGMDGAERSKKPILRHFYTTKPNLFHEHNDQLFIVANPIVYTQGFYDLKPDDLSYINLRGAEVRGRILNKIGFYTMLADNQEQLIHNADAWAKRHNAAPGADYHRLTDNNVYDVFLARGYFDVGLIKDKVNITFGHDKQFRGDGMRSLILSDFGATATFLRIRSKFGKIRYENLFMELTPGLIILGDDHRLNRNYAAIHSLGINATSWLQLGLYESTIFAQRNHFRADNVMPIMFYQTAARSMGANQKTSLGLTFKALPIQTIQLYGQFFTDALGQGWQNQYGLQLGAKYFNALTIPNLDLIGELNIVRPFMYSSDDSTSNYTHYNQPLAHPMGSGFLEFIGKLRYQPAPKMYIDARLIVVAKGSDTGATSSNGVDIFRANSLRQSNNQYGLISGNRTEGFYANLNLAYEVIPNLFLEGGGVISSVKTLSTPNVTNGSLIIYGGIRWNISRKEYDYF